MIAPFSSKSGLEWLTVACNVFSDNEFHAFTTLVLKDVCLSPVVCCTWSFSLWLLVLMSFENKFLNGHGKHNPG